MTSNKVNIEFVKYKNICIFVPTVPILLPVRSAYGSSTKKVLQTNDNTPPMPLFDAHLGGFLF